MASASASAAVAPIAETKKNKSILQEMMQKWAAALPIYKTEQISMKPIWFRSKVVCDKTIPLPQRPVKGFGPNKKQAEEEAAMIMVYRINMDIEKLLRAKARAEAEAKEDEYDEADDGTDTDDDLF